MADLPPKLFFRIGEVAGLVGVEPHVLRYWEREFRSIRPTKSAKGQRVYSRKDVENLLRVRDLLYRDGFTIAGAKKKLQRGGDPDHGTTPTDGAEHEHEHEHEPLQSAADSTIDRSVANGEPAPASSSSRLGEASVRAKLLAIRGEVEAFLVELGSPGGMATRRHPRR